MQVLLTGGTGFIGSAVVQALLADGHVPVILTRRRARPAGWPTDARFVSWQGAPTPIPAEAFAGTQALINLAGASIGSARWTARRKDILFASRIATTRALVAGITALETKPDVVISASAVGYYGSYPDDDREFTEAAPPGNDFLAVLCSHWEDEARKLVREGIRLALLRTGVVLEKDGGALPRMLLPFRFGLGGPVGSGRQVISWIHRDDLVRLIRHILADSSLSGPFNACAPNPVTNRQFAKTVGCVLHRPSFFPTPAFALRAVLGEMADLVLRGQRVIPERALDSGFTFRYPDIEQALTAILKSTST